MNPSKLYIPNPQKWMRFFDKVAKVKQSGGGYVPKILHLDKYVTADSNAENVPIKSVSPAEQTVQQAVSELKRDNIKPVSTMTTSQTSKRHRRKRPAGTKKSKKQNRGKKSKKVKRKNKGKIVKRINKAKIVKLSRRELKGGKRGKAKRSQKKKKTFIKKDIFSF